MEAGRSASGESHTHIDASRIAAGKDISLSDRDHISAVGAGGSVLEGETHLPTR